MRQYIIKMWIDTETRKIGEIVAKGDLEYVCGFMSAFSCGNRKNCLAFLKRGQTYTASPFIVSRSN